MKADRDDAPTYARQSARRSNRTTWVVASFLGSVLTVGMLYTLSALYMHDVADRILNGQKPKQALIAEITRSAPAEKDWNKIVEEQAKKDAGSQQAEQLVNLISFDTRRTVFNDHNYIPRGADNVLSLRDSDKPTTPGKPPKTLKVTVVKETKDSTCWPLKEGSIERRNCKSHVGLNYRN